MSNKTQLQSNNETLATILSNVLGLPSQESLKHGAYVWRKSDSPLPNGYTELQYIKGTGTQYIDTGFKPNNNTCYEIKYQTIPASNYAGVMGAEHNWSSTSFALWCKHAGFANSAISNQTWYGASPVIMKFDKGNLYKDGVQVWSASGSFQCDYSAYLFGINRAGTLTEPIDNLKIYYAKIWDNGTLVRDFIPCKNSSGTVGLYDLVNRRFYQNNGTGTFTAGDEILRNDSYVVADDGTKYPDGGTQDGYWYEKVVEGIPLPSGFTKYAVDKITFSSDTAFSNGNVKIDHSLGEIPSVVLLLSDVSRSSAEKHVGEILSLRRIGYTTFQSVSLYRSSSTVWDCSSSSAQITCTDSKASLAGYAGDTYYLTAGVEYTLITMA